MKTTILATLTAICCLLLGAVSMTAQCTGQDSLDCTCETTRTCNLTICVGGMNHNISIEYCQQTPVSGLIHNPCEDPVCIQAADQVAWIKKICVPMAIQGQTEAIYEAILCAIDLCSDTCFGASIPDCNNGASDPCPGASPTSLNAYCFIMAFPRCYTWNGTCLEHCDEDACNQYCYAEWRYCNYGGNCLECQVQFCDDHTSTFTNCDTGCTEFDCGDLDWGACCP